MIRNIYILLLLSLLTISWGQDCEDGYTEIDGECYYQDDLDVLQGFINNSQGGGNPPPAELNPIDLGEQIWGDGRLLELCSSTSNTSICSMNYQLSGAIPTNIGNLTNLIYLDLNNNQLDGSVPPSTCNLYPLTHLNLSVNSLDDIDFLDRQSTTNGLTNRDCNLDNLIFLDLSYNGMAGVIPDGLWDLTSLENIKYTEGNDIDSGFEEGDEWGICNLVNLQYLQLISNNLSGPVPSCIGDLTNLYAINLSMNQLTSLPESIGNLSNLEILHVGWNQLTSLPESIGDLSNIASLEVGWNQLTSLPESIGNLTDLVNLPLGVNNITSLPESIGNLNNLILLDVAFNQLTTLPESIGNLSNLEYLWIFNNNITYLPETICNLNIDWDGMDDNWYPYFLSGGNYLCENVPECIENSEYFEFVFLQFYYQALVTIPQDCPDCGQVGDLNGDGTWNILDIVNLANCILGENCGEIEYGCSGDMNGDGSYNVLDIVQLVNCVLANDCFEF